MTLGILNPHKVIFFALVTHPRDLGELSRKPLHASEEFIFGECFLQDSSSRAAVIAESSHIRNNFTCCIVIWNCKFICWYATCSVGSGLDRGACAG